MFIVFEKRKAHFQTLGAFELQGHQLKILPQQSIRAFSLCLLRAPCSLHCEGFLHPQILCEDNAFSRDPVSFVTLPWKFKFTYILNTETQGRDNHLRVQHEFLDMETQ